MLQADGPGTVVAGAVSVAAVVGIVAVVAGSLAASIRESEGSKGPGNEPRGASKTVRSWRGTRWLPFFCSSAGLRAARSTYATVYMPSRNES